MAEEVDPQGLLGLPDIAHAAIAGFCGQKGHLVLMSTSSAAMGTFGACMTSIEFGGGRREPAPAPALVGLLRRLPNLRRLYWDMWSADALAQAIVAGGWGGGLVELQSIDEEWAAALGAAIGTGNLPSLERIEVWSYDGNALTDISKGLRGGASPRLTDVQCVCDHEGVEACAEALEARMALGCCPIRRLSLEHTDDHTDVDPGAILRVCSSRALAKLKALELGGLYQEEEFAAMAEALKQLKPQELTEISLEGRMVRGFMSPGRIFACLTPAVMPSLHTVKLECFDMRSAACMEQLNAAVREGALVHMEVLKVRDVILDPLLSAVARSHGCPKLHTLKIHYSYLIEAYNDREELLVFKLAEGAFPNLRALTIGGNRSPYLEDLVGSLEGGPQCCKTLQSVTLSIRDDDTVHLPRLGKVLAGLPGLEHVKLSGRLAHWRVEGGREALVELNRAIGGLDSGNPEELQRSIQGVLVDLYRER